MTTPDASMIRLLWRFQSVGGFILVRDNENDLDYDSNEMNAAIAEGLVYRYKYGGYKVAPNNWDRNMTRLSLSPKGYAAIGIHVPEVSWRKSLLQQSINFLIWTLIVGVVATFAYLHGYSGPRRDQPGIHDLGPLTVLKRGV